MIRIVSAPCTGRRWLERELTQAFGLEVELWRVGQQEHVPVPPFIKRGEKVVIPILGDVLHVIEASDQDEDHALHALPILESWVDHYDNVHGVRLLAEDREAEEAALRGFLGADQLRPLDWSQENQGADKYELRKEYEETGRIPGSIQVLLNRVPQMSVPGGVSGHEEQRDGEFIMVTVPHTGTMFTRKLIDEQMGVKGLESLHVPSPKEASEKRVERQKKEGTKFVVTLRDPVKMYASCRNRGQDPKMWWHGWDFLTEELAEYEHVHFFVVDCNEDQRIPRLKALCEFMGVPAPVSVDWSATNTRFDKTGMAGLYLRGTPPQELQDVIADLQAKPDLVALLKREGCTYPWLDGL